MNSFYKIIQKLYLKKVPAEGLAVFRICYGIVLFLEITQLLYFKNLIFDPIPYIKPAELNFAPAFTLWLIAILFLIAGLFTKYVTIINFVMTLLTFSVFSSFEYHLDWSLIGVNFLLIFLPISKTFSVDKIIIKMKYSNEQFDYLPDNLTRQIYYYLPVFIGIGLVYFDSIFWKLASPMWQHGLGFWLPTSMLQNTYLDLSLILNMKYLSISLGYITLIFEIVFLFLIWFKKFKFPLFIIGIGLHLGIFIAYPIPLFALGISSIYLLLIPPVIWLNIFRYFQSKTRTLTVYYKKENALYNKARIILQSLDLFNKISFTPIQFKSTLASNENNHLKELFKFGIISIDYKNNTYNNSESYIQIFKRIPFLYPLSICLKLMQYIRKKEKTHSAIEKDILNLITEDTIDIKYQTDKVYNRNTEIPSNLFYQNLRLKIIFAFITYCLFAQFICILNTPTFSIIFEKIGLKDQGKNIYNSFNHFNALNRKFLGITNHGVFLDQHFKGYNHIIAVIFKGPDGNDQWLPIINESGQASYFNTGKQWAKWTWRINSPNIDQEKVVNGIRRFTSFWAHKENISLENAKFEILVKKVEVPEQWEKNFLKIQKGKPWVKAGEANWTNQKFDSNIEIIENL